MRIGIVGAGVIGRLLAFELRRLDHDVSLIDEGPQTGGRSSSYVAAGMLAPFCEAERAEKQIFDLGRESFELWPEILRQLTGPVYFQTSGSLVVAHHQDFSDLELFQSKIVSKLGTKEVRTVFAPELEALEPALAGRFMRGLYLPLEGQIAAEEFMDVMLSSLVRSGVNCRFQTRIEPSQLLQEYDWVIDCRGIQAQADLPGLRPVRGETVLIEAPEVSLTRPVRLMHPKYPLYIVPRPGGRYLLGATQVESASEDPITVHSALELLSAAYTVHPAFSEGRILEFRTGLRPAFPDHLPRVAVKGRLIRINGLYRHGFLISPAIARRVSQFLQNPSAIPEWPLFSTKDVDDETNR